MSSSLFYRFMCWYDARWRRKNNVEKIDELISLSFKNYDGDRHLMNDGTWIERGDYIAIIHFNRECFMENKSGGASSHSALRFRRLIMASFSKIAKNMNNEKFKNVKAFHGISWLPPHGEKIGFMIDRMPNSLVNKIRKFYFRILLKTFFPSLSVRIGNDIHPHAYWLTSQNLYKNFYALQESNENERNIRKFSQQGKSASSITHTIAGYPE